MNYPKRCTCHAVEPPGDVDGSSAASAVWSTCDHQTVSLLQTLQPTALSKRTLAQPTMLAEGGGRKNSSAPF